MSLVCSLFLATVQKHHCTVHVHLFFPHYVTGSGRERMATKSRLSPRPVLPSLNLIECNREASEKKKVTIYFFESNKEITSPLIK